MQESRRVRLTTVAVGCVALIAGACESSGRSIGSSPRSGAQPKDSGVPNMGQLDAGSPPITSGDTGTTLGCGANPNGCADHELRAPVTCACLAECEPGWTWHAASSTCLENGQPPPPPRDGGVITRPDTGPYDGGVPPTDMFDPGSLAQRYATAICQFTTRCEPALHDFFGSNEAACITEQTAAIQSTWSAFSTVIGANRLGFSQTAYDQCIASLGNADCVLGPNPSACSGLFTGSQAIGQRCSFSIECLEGSFCNATSIGGCGSCTAEAGPGESCSGALCQSGTDCVELTDGSRVCVPDRQPEGAGCNTIQTGLCSGRMQCVGMQTFQCMRPAAPGATCDPMASTGPACNLYQNQVCGAANSCVAVSWVGAGSSCADANRCDRTARCDDTMGDQCIAYPLAGEQCFQGLCGDDLFCDVANCAALKPMGAACQASAECDGNLRCVSGTCNPLAWTNCQ